ncbi:MAG: biotin synthase BioB [Thermoplasmatota archaeon]
MPELVAALEPAWDALATRVLAGHRVTRAEALSILGSPDEEVLALMAACYRVRRRHWGNKVHLHYLMNAQSGLCQEDCGYCSQSAVSTAAIDVYPAKRVEEIVAGASRAAAAGCSTYCIVMSGRAPSDRAVDQVAAAVRAVKAEHDLEVCACLGFLTPEKARRLKEAGVDTYNHNLNSSRNHTPSFVSTHTYDDRVSTVKVAQGAGIQACSGAIFGMGESDGDAVDVALALRDLAPRSIPVNFLHPVSGTPLGGHDELTPNRCLRILAMMRFVNPHAEIRIAGGRERNLRSLQALGLFAANSLFVDGYLTTGGQGTSLDHQMVTDLGFEIDRHPKPIP